MGGELTFVSIDDMESAQWNSEADGEHKRLLANNFSKKITWNKYKWWIIIANSCTRKWYPGRTFPKMANKYVLRKDPKPYLGKSRIALADME